MHCSVIIPCHNGADLTRACLQSLLTQSGDHQLEILLVDNASTDATASLGALDARIQVLPQPHNRGFAGGVNRGLHRARQPFCLVLNNDTQAATNLLDRLQAAMLSDDRIGAVAPTSNFVKGYASLDLGSGTRERATREQVASELLAADNRLHDVDTLAGLCLLLRRSALDECGLFDERFGHGNYEDDDLCLRLRLHGYRLVIARSAFLHHEGHATFSAMGLDLQQELQQRREQFTAKWLQEPAGRATIAGLTQDLVRAAAEAREAREQWPNWLDADWHEGRYRAASGDEAGAAICFERLLQHCPYHTAAAIELALCRLRTDDVARAQELLEWTATHCHVPPHHQFLLSRRIGAHWYGRRHWQAALQNFRAALELESDDGELHNWLGSCLLQLGDVEAAAPEFEAAAALDFHLAWTNLGICAHHRGDLTTAEQCFATACEALPHDPVASANLAALRQQLVSC